MNRRLAADLAAAGAGVLFGAGLALAQMMSLV